MIIVLSKIIIKNLSKAFLISRFLKITVVFFPSFVKSNFHLRGRMEINNILLCNGSNAVVFSQCLAGRLQVSKQFINHPCFYNSSAGNGIDDAGSNSGSGIRLVIINNKKRFVFFLQVITEPCTTNPLTNDNEFGFHRVKINTQYPMINT